MFKSWDELSRNEQLHAEFYDFYKEVHGIRPRWIYGEGGVPMYSEQEMDKMLESLGEEAARVSAAEKQEQDENIRKFEETVAALCKSMNKSRDTMVRWMFDGSDSNGD